MCVKHPELSGERYDPSRNCVACGRDNARKQYAANPEKGCEQARRWSADNPEKKRVIAERWRTANLPKVKAQQKRWRQANPDKELAKKHRWHAANPGKIGEYSAKRRTIKLKATPKFTAEEQTRIETLYAEAARLTAETGVVHEVDHDKPLALGGLHHPDNLVVVPRAVNRAKGAWHASLLDFILS